MNVEEYEHAMDVAFASGDVDWAMWRRGVLLADLVEGGRLVTWLKVDDRFAEHPKVIGLSDKAFRLHVTVLCWCARNLTDGHVNSAQLLQLRRRIGREYALRFAYVDELLSAQLWDETEDGFVVHDYLEYNPDAASVKAKREVEAQRQRHKRHPTNRGNVAVTNGNVGVVVDAPRPVPLKEEVEEEKIPQGVTHPLTEMLRKSLEKE